MAIPDFQSIMLPLLKLAAADGRLKFGEAVSALAAEFELTDAEREELLPSGTARTFTNRVGWARTHLSKAGLVSSRGALVITDRGRDALTQTASTVNMRYLRQFPEYLDFIGGRGDDAAVVTNPADETASQGQTPDEVLERTYKELTDGLATELLQRVKQNSPQYFEQLVVDVIVAMGYGGTRPDAGRALGKSGDGGIDGVVNEDVLGLDVVYLQAKRWDGPVGRPVVQAFVGSLEGHRARKGVLITTSTFSGEARDYVKQIDKRVVLIDGRRLADLMIEHGVGVTSGRVFTLKKLDQDYFEEQ